MKKLKLTSRQFDTFVFPQIASSTARSDGEFETALRLLRKLKDPALTQPALLTVEEAAARAQGQAAFAFHRLRSDEAVFLLEEDEWGMLQSRVSEHRTRVAIVAAEEFADLIETIAKAPAFIPDAPTQA